MRLKETHMSEVAPTNGNVEEEILIRNFELIKCSFDKDPSGPLLSAIWDFDIDIEDLRARRYPTDTEKKAAKNGDSSPYRQIKPVITSGELLLCELFYQIDFMQPPERLHEFQEGRKSLLMPKETGMTESDQFLFESIDRILTVHDVVKSSFQSAKTTYYGEDYWEDPYQRKGLKTDQLELLYNATEPFDNQGLLGALQKIESSGAFSADIMFEANRIARIMVARETNEIA